MGLVKGMIRNRRRALLFSDLNPPRMESNQAAIRSTKNATTDKMTRVGNDSMIVFIGSMRNRSFDDLIG